MFNLSTFSIHGNAPATRFNGCGGKNLDWSNFNIDGIPGFMVLGENEWWLDRVIPKVKSANPVIRTFYI